jgi:hypothetical protein
MKAAIVVAKISGKRKVTEIPTRREYFSVMEEVAA